MREPRQVCVRLTKALERTVSSGHPWIFRDALQPFSAQPGACVTVLDRKGRFLARGVSEVGPIAVRVFTREDQAIDGTLFSTRLRRAFELRDRLGLVDTTALRWCHGEADELPGMVCDAYGGFAVVQLDGEGIVRWKEPLLEALIPELRARNVTSVLGKTGRRGAREVAVWHGDAPPERIRVREYGMTLVVDLLRGQKTGLFLDHRESRRIVRALAAGMRVLNLYGYTGAFSLAAGLAGACEVVTVDVAASALALAHENWTANGLASGIHRTIARDVPELLEDVVRDRHSYELVIADPPSFAPNEAARAAALGSYRALHRSCLSLLRPGGYYLAASCSSHVDAHAFEGTLLAAAHELRCVLQVVARWGAAPDHPQLLAFPEGNYLKVVLVRVVEGRSDHHTFTDPMVA